MSDCLTTLFEDLRRQRPTMLDFLSNGDRRQNWLHSLGEVIHALPPHAQWAAVLTVATDIAMLTYPGAPITALYNWLIREWHLEAMDAQVKATMEGDEP